MASTLILVGSWTTLISTLLFTPSPPSLSILAKSEAGVSPSWLEPSPLNKTIFYGTNEDTVGLIRSYILDSTSGKVTQVSSVQSGGGSPAHIGLRPGARELEAVNYSGGNALNALITDDLLHFSQPSVVTFSGSGPLPNQASPHPHQAVYFNDELLIPDLGADQVWRLTRNGGGNGWRVASSIPQPVGSGPRHIVALPGRLYTLHEMGNTVTQHTLPNIYGQAARLVADISIVPPGANATTLAAGELLYAPAGAINKTPLLYASNRNTTNTAPHGNGDALAIFETEPELKLVAHAYTGLQHLRGVILAGPDQKYLVAAGLYGGGIKVFERTNGGLSLKEIAKVDGIVLPTGLVWV